MKMKENKAGHVLFPEHIFTRNFSFTKASERERERTTNAAAAARMIPNKSFEHKTFVAFDNCWLPLPWQRQFNRP